MITCRFEDGGSGTLRHVTVGVIILDKKKSKVLLVKRSDMFSEPNKLALPGGFMTRDETLEQAAAREVLEETGHAIADVVLFRINDNPDRPKEDRQNVDFIFTATVNKKKQDHDSEINNIEWHELNKLPEKKEFAFDHYESLNVFKKHNHAKTSFPIFGQL